MYYITVKQPPQYHQMTLEEFLFKTDTESQLITSNISNTKTYEFEKISSKFLNCIDVDKLITVIREFNNTTETLREKPRRELYREFYIPKRSGGLRKIDAPQPELMDALRRLKNIFETDYNALYHTSAFAYVKQRCTIDALKRHQGNESKWYAKYDLHNFFGSITLEYTLKMLEIIFPFSEVLKDDRGREELTKALELAFLDNGLPQGTPFSPPITNIIMIPIDFTLNKALRSFNSQRFCYTRYADDFQISSKYSFSFREVEKLIKDTLSSFSAPFELNESKTRYGSSSGANWNLGLMVNRENEITVGHKRKREFQAMLSSYIMDKKNGIAWDKGDIQTMNGYRNYYRKVEKDAIDNIVAHIEKKFNVDVLKMIKDDLRG